MTYHGRVKNGVIVLDPPASLPEGSEVEVQPAGAGDEIPTLYERLKGVMEKTEPPTWAEVFEKIIGKAEGLPADSSINHDHYLYGAPKR